MQPLLSFPAIYDLICIKTLLEAFKRAYYKQLHSVKDPDAITKLEGKKRGGLTTRPKEVENSLKKYIHKLKFNGSIANKMVLLSIITEVF